MRFRYVRESKREREIATNKMNGRERIERGPILIANSSDLLNLNDRENFFLYFFEKTEQQPNMNF